MARVNGWPDCDCHSFFLAAMIAAATVPNGRQELIDGDQEQRIIIQRLAATRNILLAGPVTEHPHQTPHDAGWGGEKCAEQQDKGDKEERGVQKPFTTKPP